MIYRWLVVVFLLTPVVGQSQYEFVAADSLVVQDADKGLQPTNAVLLNEQLLVFYKDTNLFAAFNLRDDNREHFSLPSGFVPYACSFYNGHYYFMDAGASRIEVLDEGFDVGSTINLPGKYKGKWTGFHRVSRILHIDDEGIYLPGKGGVTPYSKEKKWLKSYEKKALIYKLSFDGDILDVFAHYNSLFHTTFGLRWADDIYAAYAKEKDAFLIGNLLTPELQVYTLDGTLKHSFGASPEGYSDGSFPQVVSNNDAYLTGLKHHVETFNFKGVIVDDANEKVLRVYSPAMDDTSKLDQDYVRALFNVDGKTPDACMAPNPIIKDQRRILYSKPVYLQVYDAKFNYEGALLTRLSYSDSYIGSTQRGRHAFLNVKRGKVYFYTLME